jgi:ribokinase
MAEVQDKHSLDVLVIGDVLTDAFIKLLDGNAHTYENEHGKWLAVPFGQKVPFDHAVVLEAVGNAANAAVSVARLGLKSGLVANVGEDQHGRDIITSLHKQGVDGRFIHVNPGMKSNYHYVLWYKEERTILIKHEDYDYRWPRFRSSDMPKWVYLTSIAKDSLEYQDQIAEWLQAHPTIKLAFQPGTFQIEAGAKRLAALYRRTEVVILNREEAVQVTGSDYHDLHALLDGMHKLGARIVCITDGPKGAYVSDGSQRLKMPLYPDPAPPVERTGAGDAFASTFIAELAKGNTLEGALQYAPINSMNVVQKVGAQEGLLSEPELQKLLQQAPDWYRSSPLD